MKSVKSVIQTNDIAFGDTSVAAYQAKAILELINDTLYSFPYEAIDTGSSKVGLTRPVDDEYIETEVSDLSYKLIPTLIEGKMSGYIQLGKEETGYLQVFDLFGAEIHEFRITQGRNTLPIGEYVHQAGIYIYRVKVDNGIKRSGKLVKIQ